MNDSRGNTVRMPFHLQSIRPGLVRHFSSGAEGAYWGHVRWVRQLRRLQAYAQPRVLDGQIKRQEPTLTDWSCGGPSCRPLGSNLPCPNGGLHERWCLLGTNMQCLCLLHWKWQKLFELPWKPMSLTWRSDCCDPGVRRPWNAEPGSLTSSSRTS